MKELKKYLVINSAFSALSGLTMLAFSEPLNNIFNLNNDYVFPIIGINLLLFSILVWFVSNRQIGNKKLVNLICILDLLWVIGSLTIILLNLFGISQNGKIIIGIVASWIAFLAYMQFKNIGRK